MSNNENMNPFTEKMIAPCGLNCSLCQDALKKENPCHGCKNGNEGKPECCIECKTFNCQKRKNLEDGYCDTCSLFPCQDIIEREQRYAEAYPMIESPMKNLEYIRRNGINEFFNLEQQRWLCEKCGGIICVHSGKCSECDHTHSHRGSK